MEYYVLKQGRHEGPFTETEVIDQLAGGRFSPADLGQRDGARHWTPLQRLFARDESNPPPHRLAAENSGETAEAPSQETRHGFAAESLQWWRNTTSGIQYLLHRFPLETGLAFLALGCAVLLLSYVRVFIVGPILIGALFGGAIAMLRGRVFAGMGLCAAAVFVPALIWSAFFWIGRLISHAG